MRTLTAFVLAIAATTVVLTAQHPADPPRPTFGDLLATYRAGSRDVVSSQLRTATDFQALGGSLKAGLAVSPVAWDRVRAAFVLEVAIAASLHLAPEETVKILTAGRVALSGQSPATDADHRGTFERRWHETALAILQRLVLPAEENAYLDALEHRAASAAASATGPTFGSRFVLDRAIANEQAGWKREQLDQRTAGLMTIVQATDQSSLAIAHRETVRLFDLASGRSEVAIEAGLRGAAARFRVGQYEDGLASLERMRFENADQVQRYWALLIKARSLQALGRLADAERLYRQAAALYPEAQTPAIGRALVLFLMNQRDEAVTGAADVRAMRATAGDPWWSYYGADARFINQWRDELRGMLQ